MAHYRVKDAELVEAGAIQIWLQSLWARTVGLAVWVFDKLIRYLNNRFGRPILWLIARALDHLIDTSEVVTLERAKDFIDAISVLENPEITVFGCKCQRALGKRKGTYMKCMNVLYGAEAYKTPGHDYRDLTPEVAKAEIVRLTTGQETQHVLQKCTSCFACNLICPEGCNPTQTILDNGPGSSQFKLLTLRFSIGRLRSAS